MPDLTPDPAILDDIIRRIVRVAAPERIVLFGSAARGDARPDSDLDLLVVKGGQYHRRRLVRAIYRNLIGAGSAVDIVMVTPDEVERYRDVHALVIAPALREGRAVYAVARRSHLSGPSAKPVPIAGRRPRVPRR